MHALPKLVAASILLTPFLPGCATVIGIVTGPVVMPVSWFLFSKPHRSLPSDLIWAPLCLIAVPFGPWNGVVGAVADLEYLQSGSYGGVLERKKRRDGRVWVRRGLPFTAVFHPCACLMRVAWDTEDPASPSSAAAPNAPPRQ